MHRPGRNQFIRIQPRNLLENTDGCSLGAAACYLLVMLTAAPLMTSSHSEGPVEDRSSVFLNPLRSPRKWIYSIKSPPKSDAEGPYGRSRDYYETADFGVGVRLCSVQRAACRRDVQACRRADVTFHPRKIVPCLVVNEHVLFGWLVGAPLVVNEPPTPPLALACIHLI